MSQMPATNPDVSSLSRFDRVDRGCDRFEEEWASGARPRIEDYLDMAPEADRPALLRRLVALEIDLRRSQGEQPDAGPYFGRFPGQSEPVGLAFDEASPSFDFLLADPATLLGIGEENRDELSPPPTLGPVLGPAGVHAEALPTGTILGDYELLDRIGEGGMGVVYRAWQRGAERVVALKLIQPSWIGGMPAERAAEVIVLFLGEARLAAKLSHPHIVTVHDVGQVEGRPYYSMECVVGRSLAAILLDGPLPDARAAALLEPVARALQYAHDRRVLHRDLKPANILVDAEDRPYVADFGLAQLLEDPDAPLASPGRAGTPSYMSPEQARGSAEIGATSDVYGLGATLYDLLTGRPPFRAAGYRETLRQVKYAELVPPRKLNPAIGRDLEAVCLKCLAKDPKCRYATAGALADDLARCRAGLPPLARSCGPLARVGRWACRRRSRVAAVGVVVLGLAAHAWWSFTDLGLVTILAQSAPAGAGEDALDRMAARRAEAALKLARRGREALIPPLREEVRLRKFLDAKIEGEPDRGTREALRRAIRRGGSR